MDRDDRRNGHNYLLFLSFSQVEKVALVLKDLRHFIHISTELYKLLGGRDQLLPISMFTKFIIGTDTTLN